MRRLSARVVPLLLLSPLLPLSSGCARGKSTKMTAKSSAVKKRVPSPSKKKAKEESLPNSKGQSSTVKAVKREPRSKKSAAAERPPRDVHRPEREAVTCNIAVAEDDGAEMLMEMLSGEALEGALGGVRPPGRDSPTLTGAAPPTSSKQLPLVDRATGDASRLWGAFFNNEARADPPEWFRTLCEDLHFRRGSDEFDQVAEDSPVSILDVSRPPQLFGGHTFQYSGVNANTIDRIKEGRQEGTAAVEGPPTASRDAGEWDGEVGTVDPYLFLRFTLREEKDYTIGPYEFPEGCYDIFSSVPGECDRLCLGDPHRQYVCFCDAYAFPDRRQLPTAVGTEPVRLWVDPAAAIPTVLIQLAPEFPPLMWLPVKATASAIRRVLSEFALAAAVHRDDHHVEFEDKIDKARFVLQQQQLAADPPAVLRYLAKAARDVMIHQAPVREYPNYQTLFLGEHSHPEQLLEHIDLCPFLFAIPLMRTVVDLYDTKFTPTITGPGIAHSLYRCVFSKALLHVEVHLATEVKLPPQDPEAFALLWQDVDAVPPSRVPVFVRVLWPDHKRMSGGGVVARFNDAMGREFAPQMPVDAAMALHFIMSWMKRPHDLLGVRGVRERLAALEARMERGGAAADAGRTLPALRGGAHEQTRAPGFASIEPDDIARNTAALSSYPSTRDVPNPAYTLDEQVGMHIQYLAHMGDPAALAMIHRHLHTGSAPIRCGCAKAALELSDMELFRTIVANEPPGRMQHFLTKMVRRRKKRDLTDQVPRLLDEQYEYAAPLWTGRGRLDPATVEGQVDIDRLRTTGKVL